MPADRGLADALDETERALITEALREAAGNVAEAARQLRTDRANLYRRMRRLGITGTLALLVALVPARRVTAQVTVSRSALAESPPSADTVERRFSIWPSLTSGKTYNRVEGLPILLGPAFSLALPQATIEGAAHAVIRTGRGWRLSAPDGGYDARLAAHLGADRHIIVSGELYDVIRPTEPWQLTQPDQGLAAFLLRRDYFDYYGAHGGAVGVQWQASEKLALSASAARERWSSRDARNPFTLLRENSDWRPNPVTDDGRITRLTLGGVIDTRNDPADPSSGWYATADLEQGYAPSLQVASPYDGQIVPAIYPLAPTIADVQYGRLFTDVRRYNRLSPRTQLDFRGVFGGRLWGDPLPLERRFSLGGPGTIPGYDFRRQPPAGPDVLQCDAPGVRPTTVAVECDRVLLGQVELRTELLSHPIEIFNQPALRLRRAGLTARPVAVVFMDVGRGWRTDGPDDLLRGGNFKSDIGAGIDLGLFGVYVAKAVSDWSEPANALIRVRRRF